MTHDEIKRAVATALVAMRQDKNRGAVVPPTVEEVARRANVHVGHARSIMRTEFKLIFMLGGNFGWTQEQYEAVEAYAQMPVARTAAIKSQVFNIGNNHGQVVAGDNHGDFTLTVTHHVEQVVRAIDQSPLPPEKKTEAKSKAMALLETLGIEGFKAAVTGIGKGLVG